MGQVIFTLLPVTSTTASSPVVECPVDRMNNLSAALSRKAGKPAVHGEREVRIGEPLQTHWHSSARARVNPRERPCTVTLRRMRRMIWPAVLLAGLLAGCSGGPGEGVSPEAPSITAASPPPTMGTPVRDGGLEFIVNGVRLGPSISSDHARYDGTRQVRGYRSVSHQRWRSTRNLYGHRSKTNCQWQAVRLRRRADHPAEHQRDVADKPRHRYQCADCVRRPSRHSTGQH